MTLGQVRSVERPSRAHWGIVVAQCRDVGVTGLAAFTPHWLSHCPHPSLVEMPLVSLRGSTTGAGLGQEDMGE